MRGDSACILHLVQDFRGTVAACQERESGGHWSTRTFSVAWNRISFCTRISAGRNGRPAFALGMNGSRKLGNHAFADGVQNQLRQAEVAEKLLWLVVR